MNVINLKINGKEISAAINMLAIRKYCEAHNIDFPNFYTKLQLSNPFGYLDLIYFGHESYCQLANKKILVSRDECTLHVEEANADESIKVVVKALEEVKLFGKTISERGEEALSEEAKKKQTS